MKEPQKSKIIALLMDYSAGVYQNKEMVDLIESILSPLPHQDGASADTNNMTQFKIGQKVKDDVRGYGEGVVTDSDGQWILVRFKGCYQNYTSCGRWKRDHVITLHPIEVEKAVADGASAEDVLNIAQSILGKCRCEPIYTNRKMVDPNCAWCEYHVDFIQALDQFAKSESAKVVAEKDRVIYEREIEVLSLQADLLKSNARIERLEQGMANWVMVSNERQEELNEAKKRIEGLEEYKETMIIQHRLKTK